MADSLRHTLWNGQLQTPKTEVSNRVLLLPEPLVGLFEAHFAKFEFKGAPDFIFHRTDGSLLNKNHVREAILYKAMEKAGIKREKARHGFHILRHSAGSITHVRTGDLKLSQKTLGHAKSINHLRYLCSPGGRRFEGGYGADGGRNFRNLCPNCPPALRDDQLGVR
jgi:integrase